MILIFVLNNDNLSDATTYLLALHKTIINVKDTTMQNLRNIYSYSNQMYVYYILNIYLFSLLLLFVFLLLMLIKNFVSYA